MDIKSLVARIKSIRFSKKPAVAAAVEKPAIAARVKKPLVAAGSVKKIAVAAGVLAIAAGGGAYYFLVYQPQMEAEAAAARTPVAKKPQPAPPPPVAKPVIAQPAAPVSGVPAVNPEKQPPVVAQAPSAPAPAPEIIVKPEKAAPVVRKSVPKKRKPVAKPKQMAKPVQAAMPEQTVKLESKLDAQGTSQQASPQPQDVLLKPAYPPVESAPIPAETGNAPVAPVELVPVPRVITPKYNDIMTAVLRGDMDAVKELLELGWWVDKPSEDGITPLMAAVMNRDTQMVQLLLDHGAAPSVQALRLAQKNKDAATESLLEQKGAR